DVWRPATVREQQSRRRGPRAGKVGLVPSRGQSGVRALQSGQSQAGCPYRAIERPGDNRCRGDRWGVCTIRESARSAASCAAYHFIRNLQQVMNCFGFERWMFPELQQMRAANAPVPEVYQLVNTEVGTLWATRDNSDSPALMSTGAPARTSARILLGYRAA